jgi:thiamine biosynthesis lipoprotein
MRASRIIMGTGVSIDIPEVDDKAIAEAAFTRIQEIDRKFSTYKKRSEISKFRRGELREQELSAEVKKIMRACIEMEKQTEGYFSAWFDGQFDPTGYVKGWAIAEASRILEKQGLRTFCVGIGGDVNARSKTDKVWSIGIQNPEDSQNIIGVIKGKNMAVATSGTYIRGDHIFNPKTRRRVKRFKSLTVYGPDITKADVFATASFVMGEKGMKFIERMPDYEAVALNNNGSLLMTSGMPKLLGLMQLF